MGSLTDRLSEIGLALYDQVNDNNGSQDFEIDFKDVWYNIDSSVPRTPAVLIEPQNVGYDMQETGFTTVNSFTVHFTVMHSRIGTEGGTNQECLVMAENLMDVLHANRRLDSILVHSHVTSITLGLANRQKVTMRAARLVWEGWNKTRMPPL